MALTITSTAFTRNGTIPDLYTCDGKDISPALSWKDAPKGTKTFTLIVDDPDVPTAMIPTGMWDHWIVFNIPGDTTGFKEDMHELPKGAKGGKNGWGRSDYGGPCPPDREHRYFFKLYALDTVLNLSEGASKNEVEEAMKGHILEKSELIGLYNRPENR